jgi:hypothetical protein
MSALPRVSAFTLVQLFASVLTVSASAAEALPRYSMEVTLVPEANELRVEGTLSVPAASGPRRELELVLMDSMGDLRLESIPPSSVRAAPEVEPGAGNRRRVLRFLDAVPAGREITVRFKYASRTPSRFVYHIGTDAMLAGGPTSAWYPQIPEAKGVGQIRFNYPRRYRLVAGGTATDDVTGDTRSTRVVYSAPSTFSFIAAEWVERSRPGVVPMHAYLLRDRPVATAYLDGCSRILELLSREFGPYPYGSFALVEAPDSATSAAGFGGASFEGFMVAGTSSVEGRFNLAYYGHEIGHQWWGNLVTSAGDSGGALLGEGLAQFGSLRVVEALEGEAAAERYRRRGYPGYNLAQSGLGYLRDAAADLDMPLVTPQKGYSPRLHRLANSKGLLALEHLSRTIGRERFRKALAEVTAQYAFRAFPWSELQRIVSKHAGRDVSSLFAQWFERKGAPSFALDWRQEGDMIRGAVVQSGAPYDLTLELVASGAGQTQTVELAISGARTSFAIGTPFRVEALEIDPHYRVLHWTTPYRAEAEALVDYTRAYDLLYAGETEAAIARFATAAAQPPAVDRHGRTFQLEVGHAQALRRLGQQDAEREHLLAALAAPVRVPELLPQVYVGLARLAAARADLGQLAAHAAAAVSAELAAGLSVGASEAVRALLEANGLMFPGPLD